MTFHQLAFDVRECYIHLLQEHKEVIDKVRGLVDKPVTIAVNSFYYRFHGLLTHFLGYLLHSLYKELGSV